MNFLKKLASYFYPIKVHEIPSKRSGAIEVTLVNGKLVIDSENANYSYGSLQKILKKGLLLFDKNKLQQCKNILVLGVAGGSVIETLQDDFNLIDAKITGIEIDETVLNIAKKYFKIDKKPNVTLLIADAFHFIKTSNEIYDLIIIDIFNDQNMPKELFTDVFWNHIHRILSTNGLCLFNSIPTSFTTNTKNKVLAQFLKSLFRQVRRKQIEINELFVLEK